MKITFYPSKEAVLSRLAHSLKEVHANIDDCQSAIKEKENPETAGLIHNPYTHSDIQKLRRELQMHQQTEASIQDRIGLLESATEDTVCAEVEV